MNGSASPRSRLLRPRQVLLQAGGLALLWLLLSGLYDAFHLALGAFSVLLVLFLDRKILTAPGETSFSAHLRILPSLLYLPWLFWQMILAALHVAGVIFRLRTLEPSLVRFTSEQPGMVADTVLGNSITLTPGTLTVELDGKEFLVHCLTAKTAAGLASGEMQRKVAELFTRERFREETR